MLLFVCALVAPYLSAETSEPNGAPIATLEDLFARIAKFPGLEARFEEERRLALLAKPLRSEGRLYFLPPGRLTRRTEAPIPSVMILDGSKLWFGDDAGSRAVALDTNPGLRAFVSGLTNVFAGDLPALKQDYDLRFAPPDATGTWELTLTPGREDLAKLLARIGIRGQDVHVLEVRVIEAGGDETRTRFFDVDPDRRFSAEERARLFDVPTP